MVRLILISNHSLDLQAIARAHRIGQKKAVNVYRFISKDSIEEEIIDRAKRKMVLEYSIITTMDTSGVNIMQNGKNRKSKAANPDKVSNEELQTILKFGAQNLFKQDPEAKEGEQEFSKLEEMNLDDILSRAEVHQGVEQSGTALGSAEFLTQFNVADVAQMSWDELIPADLREEAVGSTDEIPEEFLMDSRRRVTAPVSYKGADFSLDDGKRKRKQSKSTKKKADPNSITDKESRNLVKAILKYGDLKRKLPDIINECDLADKEEGVVTSFMNGVVSACKAAIQAAKAESKDDKSSGKAKVISASYGPVSGLNASVLVQRVLDMTFLCGRLESQNLASFRITWQLKPVSNWAISWGPKEDSMLLIGIYKHGYGSWQQMQDDEELPFRKKFFLGPLDKALPGAIHLNRRADYLLKSIRDEYTKKDELASKSSNKISPGKNAKKPVPVPSKNSKQKKSSEPASVEESEYESMDEQEYKVVFKPIKKTLRALQNPGASGLTEKSELASYVRKNLTDVGAFIREYLAGVKEEAKLPKIKKHLWKYASYFWPRVVSSRNYRDLCNRMTVQAKESSSAIKPKVNFEPYN